METNRLKNFAIDKLLEFLAKLKRERLDSIVSLLCYKSTGSARYKK